MTIDMSQFEDQFKPAYRPCTDPAGTCPLPELMQQLSDATAGGADDHTLEQIRQTMDDHWVRWHWEPLYA